jgi:hypothetical protein
MKYGILMFPTRHPVDVAVVARQAEAAEYHGTYYDFPLVRSFPRPV